jgi:hypothetical protein
MADSDRLLMTSVARPWRDSTATMARDGLDDRRTRQNKILLDRYYYSFLFFVACFGLDSTKQPLLVRFSRCYVAVFAALNSVVSLSTRHGCGVFFSFVVLKIKNQKLSTSVRCSR